MDKDKAYSILKKFSQGLGIDLFGVADIKEARKDFLISEEVLKDLDRAVVLGLRLSSCILREIKNQPTKLYFHHYRSVNNSLDQIALRVGNFIQGKGYAALPIPASQILDWQKQKAHLSHKQIGYLAGLGWIGRNNLLVNKDLGSQFRLITILTDMPLRVDKPVKQECAQCRACVELCPAGAIKEKALDFDYTNCFDKLKQFQKEHIVEQFICGVCVNACRGRNQRL